MENPVDSTHSGTPTSRGMSGVTRILQQKSLSPPLVAEMKTIQPSATINWPTTAAKYVVLTKPTEQSLYPHSTRTREERPVEAACDVVIL